MVAGPTATSSVAGKDAVRGGNLGTTTTPLSNHLKSVEQFKGCTKGGELRKVARLANCVEVPEGDIVLTEGEIGKELFLVLSGAALVPRRAEWSTPSVLVIYFTESGGTEPWASQCRGWPALSELYVLVIGPRELDSIAEIPPFRRALLKEMAGRLRIADAQLAAGIDGRERPGGKTPPVWTGLLRVRRN